MAENLTRKLIGSHLVEGAMTPGEEIGIRIDQTITQDATGTLVMLELEAMGLDRVATEVSVQYVDHNLVQADHKNQDDHLFLLSAARRFGLWYSRAGNGVSHPVHQERFGKPGKTLAGSDSHTPAAGAMAMFAVGAGGLEVALAMAGEPLHLAMPLVWRIELTGQLPDFVSAKDVILELLRRHGVRGGVGRVLEFTGDGLADLSAMDRHVIANMGTELGATTTVFPADDRVREFLRAQGREGDFTELRPDPGAAYDLEERIDLSRLEPLIAMPSSPGNVVRVRDVAGEEICQAYIGSSANPGYRDFAVAAEMVRGRKAAPHVSLDVNPSSRQSLANLVRDGHLLSFIEAGARIHQAGCNGCIGMGQAPATGRYSLRTVPRNFPGRSGAKEDKVCLVSPETAAASALTGRITDPRDLGIPAPVVMEPADPVLKTEWLLPPPPAEEAAKIPLDKGPNIQSLPELAPLPDRLEVPILLEAPDDVSTDEILPAGARVLPYRSNIPRISDFAFEGVDPTYPERAAAVKAKGGHAVLGGRNYGQGSSREHAALAPRYLGLSVVLAKSFARIHKQNLANFGVLPLAFLDEADRAKLGKGDGLVLENLHAALRRGGPIEVRVPAKNLTIRADPALSPRQAEMILAGGLVNLVRSRRGAGG